MYSNGYIMLDFSMIDFSRHNQIIDGIYQRVFEVVGVNKFVIILGADEKTPLPACVSFTNGSYVIESFLFNFAITVDDNVRIENVSADIIKDGIISAGTTWSSNKIKNEIDNIPTGSANLFVENSIIVPTTNETVMITKTGIVGKILLSVNSYYSNNIDNYVGIKINSELVSVGRSQYNYYYGMRNSCMWLCELESDDVIEIVCRHFASGTPADMKFSLTGLYFN